MEVLDQTEARVSAAQDVARITEFVRENNAIILTQDETLKAMVVVQTAEFFADNQRNVGKKTFVLVIWPNSISNSSTNTLLCVWENLLVP